MDLKLAGKIHEIDLAVFDCDGVLLDSMPAKIEAFRRWVPAEHAALGEAFMRVVMDGFGKSRRAHIDYFYRELLGAELSPEFFDSEVERFADLCEPLCAGAPWRPGSMEFVQVCRAAGIPRYVLSGTPQQPLEAMLQSTGGAELFDVIVGSPPAKPESLSRILAETGAAAERTVFIGDADADQQAALHVGAHFVYIPSQANPPRAEILTQVADLRELLA